MKVGFYAGSFDPFTSGHLHVIAKSAQFLDKLVVGIGVNSSKSRRFDYNLMKQAMEDVMKREKLENVVVVCYDKLTADAALESGANYLIRGIRNGIDYQYEEKIAALNEEISGLDTIYIRSGKQGSISSSMVMELLQYGKDVSMYLPPEVLKLVVTK